MFVKNTIQFFLWAAVCYFIPLPCSADVLADFRKTADLSRWFVGKKTSFELAPWPDGMPGLSGKVTFKKSSSKECYPQISYFFKKPVSRGRYKFLRFKIFVVDRYRGKVCIISADNKAYGNYFNADFSSGWHTIEVDLDRMKKHNVDLEQISRLIIFTGDPPEDMTFHLGRIELIPRESAALRKELAALRQEFQRVNSKLAAKFFAPVDQKKELLPADCDMVRNALNREKMKQQQQKLAPSSREPVVLRWASSLEKIHQTENFFNVMPRKKAEIQAAQGEGESLQLAVRALKNLAGASVRIIRPPTAADGTVIPASALSVAPVGYVRCDPPRYKVDRSGYWPDPILTYAKNIFIRAQQWQSWFLDVRVPLDQKPGLYRGVVEFKARNIKPVQLAFDVRVRNFSVGNKIPYPMSFSVPAGDDPGLDGIMFPDQKLQGEERRSAWRMKCYELLLQNKVGADNLYRRGHLGLVPLKEIRYRLERGMNHYSLFNLGFWPEVGIKHCKEQIAELKRQGLLDKAMFYGYDEIQPARFDAMRKALKKVRAQYPDIPILTTAYDTSFGKATGFDGLINGYIPTTAEFEAQLPAIRKAQKAGKRVWWYCAFAPYHPYPNFLIEYPSIEARLLMGMMFWKMKPDGFLYYQVASWRDYKILDQHGNATFRQYFMSGAPVTNWHGATMRDNNGDGCMLYPTADGPIETLRLKAIRDGIEDFIYLRLLENALEQVKAGKAVMSPAWCNAAAKELIVEKELVASMTEYTRDIQVLDSKRRRIAELLERHTARSGNPAPEVPSYSLKNPLWKEFEKN